MAIAGLYACALRTSNKGEGIAYVMSNCESKQEMARSASQQRDWPNVSCVALSATRQPAETSPTVYTNWVEQKD